MTQADLEGTRGLLFDLDGTLSDYVASAEHALEKVWSGVSERLAPYGREAFLECYWRVFDEVEALARDGEITTLELGSRAPRFSRVLRELGLGPDESLLNEMADLYTEGRLEGARLFPGAADALASLSKRYVICVVTEGGGASQRAQIKKLGIADYLDRTVISHEVGLHKPDPELHRYALRAAGLEPGKCIMIADRIDWDLAPAASLGMRTMLFTQKNLYLRLREEMGFEPDWTVRNYDELLAILLPGGA